MRTLMIDGGLGFLFGLAMQHGFGAIGDRGTSVLCCWRERLRMWLYTLGLGMVFTAFLCWLAVIDVDQVLVQPLHGGTLIGGVLTGLGAGLAGALPAMLLCGVGGGLLLQSFCGLIGAAAGAALTGVLPLSAVRDATPLIEGTLFRLTLKDAWLLDGQFASLACLGALLCVAALFLRPRSRHAEIAGNERALAEDKAADTSAADDAPPQMAAHHGGGEALDQEAPGSAALMDRHGLSEETIAAANDGTLRELPPVMDVADDAAAELDELPALDLLEDEVEETDAEDAADLAAALAQSIVTSSEPTPVDDALPEVEPVQTDEDAWLEREQQDRPSPMEDEPLDELPGAEDTKSK